MANPFGGSSGSPPSAQQSQAEMMQQYAAGLPAVTRATNAQIMPTAQAQYNAYQAFQPLYNQQNLTQAQQYALPNAQIDQQVLDSNAQANANTNASLITGAGRQAATAAEALNRRLNPNYYNPQDASSRQATNLVNSINLNGLSGGETAAVERSLNQSNTATGNLGLDNATNTVSNAMNFGNALQAKRDALSRALASGTGVAQSAVNSGFNPVNVAMDRGPQPAGTTSFANSNNVSSAFTGIGSDLLKNLTSIVNTQLPLQAQSNYQNSGQGSYVANASSICCFIFLESYNGVLPWYVRVERDRYYKLYPKVAVGYKKMANWLVPAMRVKTWVRHTVNWLMVKPLSHYGAWSNGLNITGWLCWPFKVGWFTYWKLTSSK